MNGAAIYFSIRHSECAGKRGLDSRLTRCHKMLEKSNRINNMILMSIILLRIILPRHNSYSACACELSLQPLGLGVLPFLNLLTSAHDLSRSPPHFDICFLQPLVTISPNSEPPPRLVVCIHAPTLRAICHASATTAAHPPCRVQRHYLSEHASRVCMSMAPSAHAPAVPSDFRLSGIQP